jgi:hypothetical protein
MAEVAKRPATELLAELRREMDAHMRKLNHDIALLEDAVVALAGVSSRRG